jgi:hypothetical protein
MALRQAAVRVERYVGGSPVEPRTALLWAAAAELVRRSAHHQGCVVGTLPTPRPREVIALLEGLGEIVLDD